MYLFGKDLSRHVVVAAEIGVNHEGDVEAASRLLRLAAGAGADAVKFQSYTPERYVSRSDSERLERVTRFGLDRASHERLRREADELGVSFFSTPVTEDLVPMLAELCPAIKIASGDLTFEPVIRAAAKTGKPVILSTGLGTIEEIDQAVEWIRSEIGTDDLHDRLVLLHCVAAYPTPADQTNIRSVPFLRDRYDVSVGYSHHAVGIEPCLAAVALGAQVIEVHFTDRKEGRTFRDHQLSLEPSDLSDLVKRIGAISDSLGRYGKTRAAAELPGLAAMRKGIVAARDLVAGTIIDEADIMYARPATEYAAAEREKVIGGTLTVALKRGELIPRSGISENAKIDSKLNNAS